MLVKLLFGNEERINTCRFQVLLMDDILQIDTVFRVFPASSASDANRSISVFHTNRGRS